MQVAHFFAEDLERVVAGREVDRWAERAALRGAERALVRLVDAHVGVAATRRHNADDELSDPHAYAIDGGCRGQ